MQSNLRTYAMSATQVVVGLSTIARFVPPAFMIDGVIGIKAAGGTLEIVPIPASLNAGWGTGYKLGASEKFPLDGPATFYLAATGATMTAEVGLRLGSGVTVL